MPGAVPCVRRVSESGEGHALFLFTVTFGREALPAGSPRGTAVCRRRCHSDDLVEIRLEVGCGAGIYVCGSEPCPAQPSALKASFSVSSQDF